MYLISIYFDDNANKILNRYVRRIAERTGNTFMVDHNVPPHITVSAIEARNIDVLVDPFKSLERELSGGELSAGKLSGGELSKGRLSEGKIRFVSTGQMFPYVMYAAPVMNDYLLNLSDIVYEKFKDIPETTISRLYRKGSWLPHVTLGKTLSKEQMATAFSVLYDSFQPFEAKVTEIGLARVNPHEDVVRFKL